MEQTIGTPARSASRTCSPLRSSRAGSPLTSSGDALLPGDLEDPLQVQRVLRAAVDEAAGGVAQTADGGVAQGLLHPLGHLRAGHSLPAVHAGLDPVELSKDVVGEVQPPVGEDVALDSAEHPERGELDIGRRDLLALAADLVGG